MTSKFTDKVEGYDLVILGDGCRGCRTRHDAVPFLPTRIGRGTHSTVFVHAVGSDYGTRVDTDERAAE